MPQRMRWQLGCTRWSSSSVWSSQHRSTETWSPSSFSTSHIPSFNTVLPALLFHCLNASSPNLFTPLPPCLTPQSSFVGNGGTVHLCSLSREQYFIRLWPFPDQASQLFIHLGNTIYIKYQQHAMEKSIKNTVQSQPSTCKPQYFYNWLPHYCLYFSQQKQILKSHVLSLPQLARNTKFAHLCPRGKE